MPVNQNPGWIEDEALLLLDLYLRVGLVSATHPEVIKLSDLLRSLPIHSLDSRTETFRNPNGIARKLANLANFDPAYSGRPTNSSILDERVYEMWASRPEELQRIVEAIRLGVVSDAFPESPESDEGDVEVPEGRLLYRQHRVRERNRSLKKRKIASVLSSGGDISCEVCRFDFGSVYGERGEGFIECHHVRPLHDVGESTTRVSDLALLCSNCHRMIHRRAPWPTPDELREIIGPQ